MKRKFLLITALCATFMLSACNNDEVAIKSDFEVINDQSQEKILAQQEAEKLFTKLINIEKHSSDKDLMKILEDTVYFPSAYLKDLTESQNFIEKADFERISAAHREVEIKKAGKGHYFFNSYATIEKRIDNESKPQKATAKVQMELKEKGDKGYRVVRLQISPK